MCINHHDQIPQTKFLIISRLAFVVGLLHYAIRLNNNIQKASLASPPKQMNKIFHTELKANPTQALWMKYMEMVEILLDLPEQARMAIGSFT